MTRFTLIDFTSAPVGSEAVPPEDSEYHRAIHLPAEDDETPPWVLLRGTGATVVADRVNPQYLVVSGFPPAESLGMNFEAPPIVTGGDPIRVRVSVDFPRHSGVYAWALASKFPEMVSDGAVLHELLRRGDRSAEELLSGADDLDLDQAVARHPAGKALRPEDDS